MLQIRGILFSEDTIVEALRKHINFQEIPELKAGDVASACNGYRLIVKEPGKQKLWSFDFSGAIQNNDICTTNVKVDNYKKLTTIQEMFDFWIKNH